MYYTITIYITSEIKILDLILRRKNCKKNKQIEVKKPINFLQIIEINSFNLFNEHKMK